MGISRQFEVEAKFAIDDESLELPDFTSLAHVEEIAGVNVFNLSAVYYDTEDLALTRSKITLRRRTGGKDEGWHIKLPKTDAGRMELHHDLAEGDEGTVPPALLSAVRSIVRTKPLAPIARVDNERHETLLANANQEVIAEFCDDHVHTRSYLPGGEELSWREWEIEATALAQQEAIAGEVISSATELLLNHGAHQASSPSKLVMALGDSIANAPQGFAVAKLDESSPAHAVVHALKRNRDKLIEWDPKVRRDEWDSVHQMRVATRELRSHMQTFEGILHSDEYVELEDNLKQLAGVLGRARDAEVVAERFLQLLDNEQTGALDDTSKQHLREDMTKKYRFEHSRVVKALDSDKYLNMLDKLDAVLSDPPIAVTTDEAAEQPDSAQKSDSDNAEAILIERLNKAYARLVRRHTFAVDGWDDSSLSLHGREDRFHSMRKAAKKLRYSAEAIGDATELRTGKLYSACKNMQEVLGDFQDAVTSRDKLLRLARSAQRRGEDTFGYGVLYQQEHQLGLDSLEDYQKAYKKIVKAYEALAEEVRKAEKDKRKAAEKARKKAEKKAAKLARKEAEAARKLSKQAKKEEKRLAKQRARIEEESLAAAEELDQVSSVEDVVDPLDN